MDGEVHLMIRGVPSDSGLALDFIVLGATSIGLIALAA
jgi:hypothetical protein